LSIEIWISLVVTGLLISISPGAGALNTMKQSIKYGFKNTLYPIFGLQLGWFIQIIIVFLGLGNIIIDSTILYNLLSWLGAIYLIILGIKEWNSRIDKFDFKDTDNKINNKHNFWSAVLINLLNIKATILLVAILPIFLTINIPFLKQVFIIACTLIFLDIIVMIIYASLASKLRFIINDSKNLKILNIIVGSILILLGFSLLYNSINI